MAVSDVDARWLILGGDGQLARAICRAAGPRARGLSRSECDLTQRDQVRAWLAAERPQVIVNCAAWTAVDAAEQSPQACFAVNAEAVRDLAAACGEYGALLVQISTDYVFGAARQRQTPYFEDDPPGPLSVYGRSKLAGEEAAALAPEHLIVRTCGLYGALDARAVGKNFPAAILRAAQAGRPLRVVDDQTCTPSYVGHVAQAIVALVERGGRGLFHATNSGATTWHAFAVELLAAAGWSIPVEPIRSADWPAAAQRPAYSVLSCNRLAACCGEMPSWQAGLRAAYRPTPADAEPGDSPSSLESRVAGDYNSPW